MESGQLRQLSPFTDENGIMRVSGRIDQALVSYGAKHPMLLPRNHWMYQLITRHSHEIGQTGVATTEAKIRKKYWILRGHDLAKSANSSVSFAESSTQKLRNSIWPTCHELVYSRLHTYSFILRVITSVHTQSRLVGTMC